MGLFDKVQTLFASSGKNASYAVVDAGSLSSGRGRSRAGGQIATLKRLSEFSHKEGIPMTVIFEGRRLREISEDDQYAGIPVIFVSEGTDMDATLIKTAKQHNNAAIVTGDSALLEKLSSSGQICFSGSTLKKALDSSLGRGRNGSSRGSNGGGRGEGGRGEGGRSEGGSPRRRSRRRRSGGGENRNRENRDGGNGKANGDQRAPEQEARHEDPRVLDLIDPL